MTRQANNLAAAKAVKPKIWDGRGDRLEGMRYTVLPADVADDLDLGILHLRFLTHIGRQNAKRGFCRISQAELAQKWGCSRSRLNQAIKALVRKGYVRELVSQQTRECWCSYQIIISAGDELPDGEVFRRGNTTTHNEGSVPPEAQKCAAEGTGVSRGGNTYTDLTDLPDQRGGAQARPAPVDLKQKTLDQADRALVIYNSFAEKNRLERCARLTPKRRSWLSKRLNEIGGLENFERALSELPNDDWLMGRVIHNGRSFTLTLDRLLYTGGDVGDRLANLLDAAIEAERSLTARSVAERKLERLPKNT